MGMKHQRKLLPLILSVLMVLNLMFAGIASVFAEGAKTFDLVEVTDFHGQLLDSTGTFYVGAALSKAVKVIEAGNPDTLVLGGGDLYQGTPLSNVLHGVPVKDVFTDMGLKFTALGNHEFDWGLDTIRTETMAGAGYQILCANVYDKTTGQRVFDPYTVTTMDGVRIAIVSAITADAPNIILPANVANYQFTGVAAEVNACVQEIRSQDKADVVLAVIHEGGTALQAIVSNLHGVDAVFGGHSHSTLDTVYPDADGKNVPAFNANYGGKGFVDVKMTVDTGSHTVSFSSSGNYKALVTNASTPLDPTAKAIIDAANADLAPIFNEVIGSIPAPLTKDQAVQPFGESQLGNWMSDVIKNYAGADIGMCNNGGIRLSPIPAGNVTVGTIFNLMPFDNTVCMENLTGLQLKALLNQAVQDNGKGIQLSGVKFSYDSTRPSGNRVTKIVRESDGSPVQDADVLKVAAPDFLETGGDGFSVFLQGTNFNNTYGLVRDALVADVRAHATIPNEMPGRITNEMRVISVLATSDLHGNIYNWDYAAGKVPASSPAIGLATVSTFVKGVRAANPNVILIDNGDTIQGTPLSYYYDMIDRTSEYPMMKVMGAMKYDSWTLGNHEYNYGLDTLNRIIGDAEGEGITVLSANTYKTADNTNFVKPYIVKSFPVGDKTFRVGILGLTTKTIPSWEDAAHYAGLQFNDLVAEAQKWVPVLRNTENCDVVIVAAHSGEEGPADVIPENQVKAIATGVSGIDAIVAGHAHSTLNDLSLKNPDGKTVPVLEPSNNGKYVSEIDITVNGTGNLAGLATKNVKMDPAVYSEDTTIKALAQPYQDQTLQYIQTVLGTSAGEFKGTGQYVVPTAIMDLVNKVQMDAAGTQLSIAAPLSASAYIPQGNVTIKDIMGVYVYENFLYGVKMTGKQLKNWLEYSVRYYKQVNDPTLVIDANTDYRTLKDAALNIADYNLDQLYGATYDIDLTQPACALDSNGLVVSGSRIKNLKYNGRLVKDTDVFTVAINNYRYNGGGGFMKAVGLSNSAADYPNVVVYDSARVLGDDGQVRSLMMSYIQKNGTITPTCSNSWKLSAVPVVQVVEVTGIILDNAKLDIRIGNSQKLTATVLPENATNRSVIWKSSDESVATVADGVVTALKKGTATITATTADGNFTASAVVNASQSYRGIMLNRTSVHLKVGHTERLNAVLVPGSSKIRDGIWESSDPNVVTVENGVITGVSEGTATITVTTADGKYQVRAVITVVAKNASVEEAA